MQKGKKQMATKQKKNPSPLGGKTRKQTFKHSFDGWEGRGAASHA